MWYRNPQEPVKVWPQIAQLYSCLLLAALSFLLGIFFGVALMVDTVFYQPLLEN